MQASLLQVPVLMYAGLNLLAAVFLFIDKLAARTGAIRIPENLLLIFGGIGPFGALAGMILFRHKTRHVKFYIVSFFAALHAGVIGYLYAIS